MHATLRELVKRTADKLKVPLETVKPAGKFISLLDLPEKKPKRAPVTVDLDAVLNEARSDPERYELCMLILGRNEMAWRAKRWRDRWRSSPGLMRDILGEVRFRSNVSNRGAYAERLWKKANK